MLRYALPLIPALFFALPATAQDDAPLTAEAAMRCGVLNSLMGVLEEGDAEKSRARNAIALTWFSLANDMRHVDEAERKATFDRVHNEEGEAVVALPAEGEARAEHLLQRLDACDELKYANAPAYRSMADFLATADAAQFAGDAALRRQGKEPPPIPEKDLGFGDGWTFQSRGNDCTAVKMLNPDLELRLGFNNFEDGAVWLTGSKLPPFPDEDIDAAVAKHDRGAVEDEAAASADGIPVYVYAPGVTYANYPGTALFVDGKIAARIVYGATEQGETAYRIGHLQGWIWPKLKAGKELRAKVLGKEVGVVQLRAAGGLWAEMQACIDQYPEG
ncbi:MULTISPECIES: hypothetical protein [unclassified Sphingopyxis]|uniref:hypothetical protein n=1 Tax=unclassified Sphingopyxis TaxID=2614943 RepID=UPI00073713F5|nr:MULTISPECIES: hypothetical protein [unclassified Sphingopyxis]KTE37520.1 hypothetical protein ATE62_13465 [Sphingopyxis sp. HIX]KTE82397.1 hypothetical protein ATE72_15650 [Sphingopyxis sp. HXXIV]